VRQEAGVTSAVRLLFAVTVLGVVALTDGCGQTATVRHMAPTEPSRPLPTTINGVPLAALARQALVESKTWSVTDPKDVRVVVSSQAGMEHLLGYNGTVALSAIDADPASGSALGGCRNPVFHVSTEHLSTRLWVLSVLRIGRRGLTQQCRARRSR